jgi:hypothetical protein
MFRTPIVVTQKIKRNIGKETVASNHHMNEKKRNLAQREGKNIGKKKGVMRKDRRESETVSETIGMTEIILTLNCGHSDEK